MFFFCILCVFFFMFVAAIFLDTDIYTGSFILTSLPLRAPFGQGVHRFDNPDLVKFVNPVSMTIDPQFNQHIYIVDQGLNAVIKVDFGGSVNSFFQAMTASAFQFNSILVDLDCVTAYLGATHGVIGIEKFTLAQNIMLPQLTPVGTVPALIHIQPTVPPTSSVFLQITCTDQYEVAPLTAADDKTFWLYWGVNDNSPRTFTYDPSILTTYNIHNDAGLAVWCDFELYGNDVLSFIAPQAMLMQYSQPQFFTGQSQIVSPAQPSQFDQNCFTAPTGVLIANTKTGVFAADKIPGFAEIYYISFNLYG